MADEVPHVQESFVRLFIAVAVPPAVRQEIGRAQSRWRREAPPGAIRWSPPDQFHITLKFLGDMAAAQIPEIEKSVGLVCARSPALALSAQDVGFFPNERKPRVIWVGAGEREGQLAELHRQIDAALRPLAPAERTEKFSGHITLGRFKPGHHAAISRLVGMASRLRGHHFGDWTANEVKLVRSDLTSARAEHTVIRGFPLGGYS